MSLPQQRKDIPTVEFDRVSKCYGAVTALDELTFDARSGELLVLVGPSGCGKTTALRLVAGLEALDAGRILIDGADTAPVRPRDRDCAMVFQSYALYPHLTVAENIGFGLKARRTPRGERNRRIADAAERLGLSDQLGRLPKELSGGQRQRVALGRAIVREPKVFLFDEPLSNLDAALREQTRGDIVALQRRTGTTTLYVTHDQTEAMTMGDRVLVLHEGRRLALDTPRSLYDGPPNLFTAEFLGRPRINLFEGTIGDRDGSIVHTTTDWTLPPGSSRALQPDRQYVVGVRPEDLTFAPPGDPSGPAWRIERSEFLGARMIWTLTSEIGTMRVATDAAVSGPGMTDGECVNVAPNADRLLLFDPATGDRIPTDAASSSRSGGSHSAPT